jgi:hypothetical protein
MDRQRALKYGAFLSAALPPGFRVVEDASPAGFIAENIGDPKEIVVVMPGTGTSLGWYDDLHVALVPFDGRPGSGRAGYGYLEMYRAMRAAALCDLLDERFAGLPITLAAHGIGAALATVLVLDAASRGGRLPDAAYLFGSPRVGDDEFVAAYHATGVRTWRIANYRDLTQRIPAADYGYSHVGTLVSVDSAGVAQLDHVCTHAMTTYLHLLDPSSALDERCAPAAIDREMAAYLKAKGGS